MDTRNSSGEFATRPPGAAPLFNTERGRAAANRRWASYNHSVDILRQLGFSKWDSQQLSRAGMRLDTDIVLDAKIATIVKRLRKDPRLADRVLAATEPQEKE